MQRPEISVRDRRSFGFLANMTEDTVVIFRCIILLMSYLHVVCGEDDLYLVCSHTQDAEYPSSGWCRPVKRHLEAELEEQMERLRTRYRRWTQVTILGDDSNATCDQTRTLPELHPDILQYVDTVIAPFLELYHSSIRNAHAQMSRATHQRAQKEMATALADRDKMYEESKQLIAKLQVPDYCSEEKRAARRVSHHLVAAIAGCTERSRRAVRKMKGYLEEMIALSKKHLGLVGKVKLQLENCRDVATCISWLSAISVELGYELEVSTTIARMHLDMSADRMDACVRKARSTLHDETEHLHKQLRYCVVA